MPTCSHHAQGYNPSCGDHLHVYVKVDQGGIIEDIAFIADACAVATASASMMTEAIKGISIATAETTFKKFNDLVSGKPGARNHASDLGPLLIFKNLQQYPSRIKCALLPWEALLAALQNQKETSSE
ncbi:MAG TPA: SUF system NifU family Fe-S cluster assembly protein [Candidatus Bathyarchaeia archaeon]|nr:SUF system NifU family Fe-S cluster assembly protein [Candidatus Bathyarchaeia archaeon]